MQIAETAPTENVTNTSTVDMPSTTHLRWEEGKDEPSKEKDENTKTEGTEEKTNTGKRVKTAKGGESFGKDKVDFVFESAGKRMWDHAIIRDMVLQDLHSDDGGDGYIRYNDGQLSALMTVNKATFDSIIPILYREIVGTPEMMALGIEAFLHGRGATIVSLHNGKADSSTQGVYN